MKISVIIPTYNRFYYLCNAIKSVNTQTYKNIELIIVNDASTQSEYYTEKLSQLVSENSIIINMKTHSSSYVGKDGRAAYIRNVGLRVATGDFISFLDDDDIWLPNKLQIQLDNMKSSGCEMSCTEGYIGNGVYNSSENYPLYLSEYFYKELSDKGITSFNNYRDLKFLQQHNCCIASSVIISKNIIKKIGFFPYKRIGEDYEYWLNALQYTNCAYINQPLIYYDKNHGDGCLY